MTTLSLSRSTRAAGLVALLAGVAACSPATPSSTTTAQASGAPVLLSCPAGQQPLLRQVVVNGASVPQVECVLAPTGAVAAAPVAATPVAAPMVPQAVAPAAVPMTALAPQAYAPVAAEPVQVTRTVRRPAARRVVYTEDGYDEVRVKPRRSWKKSALIIGSSAGVGAGIGAATGGKKGALIGAAVGGGAATIWDQVTRR